MFARRANIPNGRRPPVRVVMRITMRRSPNTTQQASIPAGMPGSGMSLYPFAGLRAGLEGCQRDGAKEATRSRATLVSDRCGRPSWRRLHPGIHERERKSQGRLAAASPEIGTRWQGHNFDGGKSRTNKVRIEIEARPGSCLSFETCWLFSGSLPGCAALRTADCVSLAVLFSIVRPEKNKAINGSV